MNLSFNLNLYQSMRNRFINLLGSICFCWGVAACTAEPPKEIRSGEIWPDNQGVHVNAHGGGVLYHDGTYYWYGENKSDSTSSAMVGIMCYSSKNLTDWNNEGAVLPVVLNDSTSDIVQGCVMERPKVIYNEKTKKFVMWFHLELKGKGYAAARSAVAISDSPIHISLFELFYLFFETKNAILILLRIAYPYSKTQSRPH
jgi:hypothetical protein